MIYSASSSSVYISFIGTPCITYMWNSVPCLVNIINQFPPSVHEIDPEYLEVTMKSYIVQGLDFCNNFRFLLSFFLILYSLFSLLKQNKVSFLSQECSFSEHHLLLQHAFGGVSFEMPRNNSSNNTILCSSQEEFWWIHFSPLHYRSMREKF